jgi:hypothetical protein
MSQHALLLHGVVVSRGSLQNPECLFTNALESKRAMSKSDSLYQGRAFIG